MPLPFPLYASADHFFVVNRCRHSHSHSNNNNNPPSQTAAATDLSWEQVRLVQQLVYLSLSHPHDSYNVSCPICLDNFVCPRITKCGHSFCLTCLIRHLTFGDHKNNEPKCPCCSASLHLTDVRPVEFVSVTPPRCSPSESTQGGNHLHNNNSNNKSHHKKKQSSNKKQSQPQQQPLIPKMTFVKLHRVTHCPAPYLPQPHAYLHAAPHAWPTQTDVDAQYSRIRYIDTEVHLGRLQQDRQSLVREAMTVPENPQVYTWAQDFLEQEWQTVQRQVQMERQRQAQWQPATAGVNVPISPSLVYTRPFTQFNTSAAAATRSHTVGEQEDGTEEAMANLNLATDTTATTTSTESYTATETTTPKQKPSTRPRSASVESTSSSCGGTSSHSLGRPSKNWKPGSLYLSPSDETLFYQAKDGQLCFLCAFNVQSLKQEFQLHPNQAEARRSEPLPDSITGRVLQIEHVVLTHNMRQRLRFLSHLPVGTAITLVELAMGHVLSPATKKATAAEFQSRRQAREKKARAEQRAEDRATQREQVRIAENRARMPIVNQVFRAVNVQSDEFGPCLVASSSSSLPRTVPPSPPHSPPSISFSAMARQATSPKLSSFSQDDFPTLGGSVSYPPLGSSPPLQRKPAAKKTATTTTSKTLTWTPHILSKGPKKSIK